MNLDCAPDTTIEPDLVVDGWIRRLAVVGTQSNDSANVTPQQYLAYIKNNLWYDAITDLAERHFNHPEDARLSATWTALLKDLGFAEVSTSPLVNFSLVQDVIDI